MQDISGRKAVVTGGGDGIGRALVLELARAGANVAVVDNRASAAAAVAAEARALGVRAQDFQCDVSDGSSVTEMAREVTAEMGSVQIVWANAGLGIANGFTTANREDLCWMYSVNVDGVIDCVRSFATDLKAQSGFRAFGITGSMMGLIHPEGTPPAYAASKYAVVGIAEGLRIELEPEGIGVTVLCPGLVNTRIWDGARARPERFGGPIELPEEVGERFRKEGLSPVDVARWGVEALRSGRFFALMPQNEALASELTHRHEEMIAALRMPSHPEASLSEVEV